MPDRDRCWKLYHPITKMCSLVWPVGLAVVLLGLATKLFGLEARWSLTSTSGAYST
jgi:hypothetical protein